MGGWTMMRTEPEIREKIAQHRRNLELLRSDRFPPDVMADPDVNPDVLAKMIVGLEATIRMLEWTLEDRS
jgi:hypothetical protein